MLGNYCAFKKTSGTLTVPIVSTLPAFLRKDGRQETMCLTNNPFTLPWPDSHVHSLTNIFAQSFHHLTPTENTTYQNFTSLAVPWITVYMCMKHITVSSHFISIEIGQQEIRWLASSACWCFLSFQGTTYIFQFVSQMHLLAVRIYIKCIQDL